jgi:hypothetical protein
MQCKDLESVLAAEGLGPLPAEAHEHLAACADCQGFLADLHSIVTVAKTLPGEVDPPDRVWINLRAQLEAEGLIKEPVEVPGTSPWWENFRFWWTPRSLAAAAAALVLVVTGVFLTRTPPQQQAKSQTQQPAPRVAASPQPAPPAVSPAPAPAPAPVIARNPVRGPIPRVKELAPSPSELASTTLTQAELDVPNMQLAGNSQVDDSLRQNLRTLNEFIAECQLHLRQNPQDELAREYLNSALQQKADLLAAMMESGRSEH